MPRCAVPALLLSFLLMLPVTLHAQGESEIVRGRITDVSKQPIGGATVTITAAGSQQVRTARTDADGKYSALFLDGGGSYALVVRKVGYSPALLKATRKLQSNVIEVDAALKPTAFALEPLTITAPSLGAAAKLDKESIGAREQDLLKQMQFLTDPGNLDALIGLTPGVLALGDSGYSAMGTASDQNSKLLDGMAFNGSSLPPDGLCGAGVALSTSDPSRGGFAGGQTSLQSCRGREYFESTLRGTLIDPSLTWYDAAAPVSPSRLGTFSGFASGALSPGKTHYRISFIANSRAIDAPSLLAPRAALLPQLGLSPDTLSMLSSTLNTLRVPLTLSNIPDDGQFHSGSAILTFDANPWSTTSVLITATGALNGSNAAGLSQTAYPASLTQGRNANGQVQLRASTYLNGFIDDFTAAVSANSSHSTPYLALPGGLVRVGTLFSSGQSSLTSLRFGGSTFSSEGSGAQFNIKNQLSWLAQNGFQQRSFGQQVIVSHNTALQSANSLGTFTYQSLGDLAANNPASFVRTLGATERSSSTITESAWLRDVWKVSKALSIEGGLRFDAMQFGGAPANNPEIETLFGHRTDQIPSDFGFSPRLGFAWGVHPRPPRKFKDANGVQRTVGYLDVTDLDTPPYRTMPRGNTGTGVTMIGDIGAYRGTISPAGIAALADRTGLAGTSRTLSCVGDATPIPDWSTASGADFTACRDGSTPFFSAIQPSVLMFDPSMRAPVDWKLNLGLTGLYLDIWSANVTLSALHEQNTQSSVDLNLRRTPGFTLASEDNRPVYADVGGIVPTSGLLAPGANRIAPQYGAVTNTLSDLSRNAFQFNVQVNTPYVLQKFAFQLSYTYSQQSNQFRGFGGTTAGDPFAVESTRGAQPTHQLVINMPFARRVWWFSPGLRVVVSSGTPYTPTVSGDINGDGLYNDRAFIFSPATTSDTAVAAQMRTLLSNAPGSARSCLNAQLGAIAGANSCHGPAQVRLDLNLDLSPPQGIGLGDRLHVTTRFFNAGAALMRVLGVSSAVAQGAAPLDGRLLYVTGFDPATKQYSYRVNQAFGQPLDFGLGSHRFPPFQLQVGLEYKFGVAPNNPNLRRVGLVGTKEAPITEVDVRRALANATTITPAIMLVLRDSLALSETQVASLQALAAPLQHVIDSIVPIVVRSILQAGPRLTDGLFISMQQRVSDAKDKVVPDVYEKSMALLSEAQRLKYVAIRTAQRTATQ